MIPPFSIFPNFYDSKVRARPFGDLRAHRIAKKLHMGAGYFAILDLTGGFGRRLSERQALI